jgi:hypothetical protein
VEVPFIIGFIMGAAFVACGFVLMFTNPKRRKPPEVWTEEHYQSSKSDQPLSINRKRIIEL